ncbi:thioredoxin-domain-containing protein [Glonium stellatum]|uniref:Thioredoxin-domain-containing protein n=1 Tax=Glonium stellatum TaxID=574774 RepID=A0A8E2ETQ8_9PEZI|nr:thioredoxin-domain-containing protein [Glonium stellatum]
MSKIAHVTSSTHFNTLLSSSTYLVVDFYADWCGPCKAIAPIFQQLATAEAKPGRLQFCKVDVDGQADIAKKYSVTAMPTFLIFKNGSVIDTIRGANPSGLRSAVLKASSDATKGPAKSSAAFGSKGHVLGSAEGPATSARNSGAAWSQSFGGFGGSGLTDTVVRFVALYVTSLLSFDGYHAAEESPFNVRNRR